MTRAKTLTMRPGPRCWSCGRVLQGNVSGTPSKPLCMVCSLHSPSSNPPPSWPRETPSAPPVTPPSTNARLVARALEALRELDPKAVEAIRFLEQHGEQYLGDLDRQRLAAQAMSDDEAIDFSRAVASAMTSDFPGAFRRDSRRPKA